MKLTNWNAEMKLKYWLRGAYITGLLLTDNLITVLHQVSEENNINMVVLFSGKGENWEVSVSIYDSKVAWFIKPF